MSILAYIHTFLITGVLLSGGAAGEQDRVSTIDAYLTECHNRHLFNGSVLVAHRDRVLFKKGYGYADRC